MQKRGKENKDSWCKGYDTGPILKELMLFSLPFLVGNIFQQLYNTVDSIAVGRFVGSDALGAVTGAMPATVIAQFVSSFMGLYVLFCSPDDYSITWKEMKLDRAMTRKILVICILEFFFAPEVVQLFNSEAAVVEYGTLYIHLNCLFDVLCAGNQVYAAVLSGIGDAKEPTFIMIFSFVVFRQLYLLVISHIMYTAELVSLGCPAGWLVRNIIMTVYLKRSRWESKVLPEAQA